MAFAAHLAAGCGITVLVAGEPGGAGGEGSSGQGGDAIITTSTTTGVPPPPDGCTASCSVPPNGMDTCDCNFPCAGFGEMQASCAPSVDLQGVTKIKCVCTVFGEFTGICFEKDPTHLCDAVLGCCGKYLGK